MGNTCCSADHESITLDQKASLKQVNKTAAKSSKENTDPHYPNNAKIQPSDEMNTVSPRAVEALKTVPPFSIKPSEDSKLLPEFGPFRYEDKSTYNG